MVILLLLDTKQVKDRMQKCRAMAQVFTGTQGQKQASWIFDLILTYTHDCGTEAEIK